MNLFHRVVNIKTRPAGAIDAEHLHEGHGTVMSSSNSHTTLVQNRSNIVRMHVLHVEGDHTTACTGFWPVQLDIRGLAHLLQGMTDQEMLVGLHRLHAQSFEILDCGCQTDALGNRGCTSLKFPGEIVPTGPLKSHFTDHVTTV